MTSPRFAAFFTAFVLASAGCSRGNDAATPPAGPTRLVVAFTGEDLGRVEPCGCTSAMLGGLARRPARIRASMEPGVPFAYVSGGRLVAETGAYDLMRLRTILRALGTMNCAAFAPSKTEAAFRLDQVAAMARDSGVPTTIDGPVKLPTGDVAAYAVGELERSGARTIGAIRAKSPAGAALVVLTDQDLEGARKSARDAAGPTLVLYAAGRAEPRESDVTPGAVAFAPYPAKGEFVGVARLVGDAWTVEYRPVLHDLPEDPKVVAQRKAHLAEMRGAEIVRRSAGDSRWIVGEPQKEPGAYVGNGACTDCHANATKSWTASKHAKAMESLVHTGDDVDPGCVRCHVVGYGTGRGFVDAQSTPLLADVGCEACHGPRARHVEERRAGRVDPPPPPAGERSCTGCHEGEHDPDFEFAPRWARIVHDGR